jgi:hypothetical protein
MADGQPARARHIAFTCLKRAGKAAQQRGLATPVGGHEADAVAGADGEVELCKQRAAEGDAEIADID